MKLPNYENSIEMLVHKYIGRLSPTATAFQVYTFLDAISNEVRQLSLPCWIRLIETLANFSRRFPYFVFLFFSVSNYQHLLHIFICNLRMFLRVCYAHFFFSRFFFVVLLIGIIACHARLLSLFFHFGYLVNKTAATIFPSSHRRDNFLLKLFKTDSIFTRVYLSVHVVW